MKVLTKEDKDAHAYHVAMEAVKGFFYGGFVAAGAFYYLKKRQPQKLAKMTTSVKTAVFAIPTAGLAAFWGDQGSWEYDQEVNQGSYKKKLKMEEYQQWSKLSTGEKIIHGLNEQKYPIIISTWVALMYGSWVYVNRDKIMTTAQKAVQARMYAQAITIVLLLSTVVLAVKEQEIEKKRPAELPEWKRVLMEREMDEKDAAQRKSEMK